MLAVLLIEKIFTLFLILLAGAALVRWRILSSRDSRILSLLLLYLLMPCVILNAFQVDFTPEVGGALALAFAASILIHVLLVAGNRLLKKPLGLDPVEQMSVIYPNAGNLIIPLVTSMLGGEWVIYTSAFITVQMVLIWTHGQSVLCGEGRFAWRKILRNPNMIAILAGIFLFATRLRFPGPVDDAITSLGSMVGPASMLLTGMLIGGMDLRRMLSHRRLWLVAGLRLIAVPLLTLALIKYSGITSLLPGGADVLLVTFLATCSPSASSVTSMAQVYGKDADYASAINVATTLCCIVTMPLMVALYTL